MKIETKELCPELWLDVEALFGPNGAVGGCWCMSWRTERGETWDDVKGAPAKRRLRTGVASGGIRGILAYADGAPVGWCTFGPRRDFAKLDRAPSLRCEDADEVWSVPCFFVKAGFREQGVSRALLRHALRAMKRLRVKTIEGYPSKPAADGRYVSAFAWTGTRPLFYKEGFTAVGNKDGGKQRVRKDL